MELFVPNSVIPIGGKSQPWYGRSCKMASRQKQESFHAWANAMSKKDPNAGALKKQYNSASRVYKREIAKSKSEFIGSIGEKLIRYPSGSRAFWSLAKAVQGNFCKPSLPPLRRGDDTLAHSSKEKADLLGALFASNSTMDDGEKVPPAISRCRVLCLMCISDRMLCERLFSVSKHTKRVGLMVSPPLFSKHVLRNWHRFSQSCFGTPITLA
ncbi:unnamed protein product [Colias eurytheme]|nr:unnamed protein product [Colias eurytheme]